MRQSYKTFAAYVGKLYFERTLFFLISLREIRKNNVRSKYNLAVAVLGANQQTLLNDLNFAGFLFESMVVHDIRVYGQANDAKV